MSKELPRLFVARHGDTAWTDSHQRTGRTDLPLNERGEERARQIGRRLARYSFARVFTSPLQRASKTCALAGYGEVAEADADLPGCDRPATSAAAREDCVAGNRRAGNAEGKSSSVSSLEAMNAPSQTPATIRFSGLLQDFSLLFVILGLPPRHWQRNHRIPVPNRACCHELTAQLRYQAHGLR